MPEASSLLPTLHQHLAQDETVLDQLVDRLASVRKTVADTEVALHAARREQQLLEARVAQKQLDVDAQRHMLRPVTRLPDEPLMAILRWLHDDVGDDEQPLHPYLFSRKAALLWSSICRRWRSLAISCPRLWARIYLDLVTATGSQSASNLLDLHLLRSRESPLEIRVILRGQASVDSAAFMTVLGQSTRWRIFHASSAVPDDVLSRFHRPTPILERFKLSHDFLHMEVFSQPAQHLVVFLPYAPRLHSLELATCMLQRLPQIQRPSLHQVYLGFCFLENPSALILDFLSTSPSVQDASIFARLSAHPPSAANAAHVSMPSLTRLRVNLNSILPYLNVLSLPALRSIHVFSYRTGPGVQVLFQKYAHIRELVLVSHNARDVAPGQLPRVLADLQRLESLRLDDFPVSQDDFVPLSAVDQATGTWTLPALVEFDVTYGSLDLEAASSCIAFVRSRTVDNMGSGGVRARLTRATVRSGPKGAGQLDWLQKILSGMCGDAGEAST